MSETKWTPGPWRIDQETIGGSSGITICAMQGPLEVCPAFAHGLGDARLIAAAPDLYAALERICANVWYADNNSPDVVSSARDAEAVLAKARGEQP